MRVTKKFMGACCIGKRVFNTAAAPRRAITPEDGEVRACVVGIDELALMHT
jgi:hypothetical protein